MAQKTYVDPLLTRLALGYRAFGHISEKIMPMMPVKKATGKIGSYGADNIRIITAHKGDDAETAVATMSTSISDGWVLEPHALKAFASDRETENEDAPFQNQRDKTEFVMDVLATGREFALASYMGTVGNFTNNTTLSGTSQWGGSADDPVDDINTAITAVSEAIGVPQQKLTIVMSQPVFRVLKFLPEMTALLNTTGRLIKLPTGTDLAEAFDVKEVIVADSFYNSSDKGQASSLAQIWGKHCWIGHFPSPALKIQPFGYTCHNKGALSVDKWYDKDRKGWWIRAEDEYDQLVTNELAVYMIEDAVA